MPSPNPEGAAKPSSEPSLRFYHSADLRQKTLDVLDALEEADDPTQHRGALTDLVQELTESGMAYYFVRPLKLAEVGFVTQQSANVGMGAIKRVMSPVIRNIIGRMDGPQLRVVSRHLRDMMA